MDLVYIVSPDKIHDNIELKYSIRSAVKHLKGFKKLIIVGYCPPFIKPSVHIPAEDIHPGNIARNIYEKILAAVNDSRVSSSFICISDDHFFLRDYEAATFPYFFEGSLKENYDRLHDKNNYKAYVLSTYNALKDLNLPTLNFNTHTPIIYNKKLYKKVMGGYDWNVRKGYISKSLYCNSLQITGEYMLDVKIGTPKTRTAIPRRLIGARIFSTNQHAINAEMKEFFESQYPEKSKWEYYG